MHKCQQVLENYMSYHRVAPNTPGTQGVNWCKLGKQMIIPQNWHIYPLFKSASPLIIIQYSPIPLMFYPDWGNDLVVLVVCPWTHEYTVTGIRIGIKGIHHLHWEFFLVYGHPSHSTRSISIPMKMDWCSSPSMSRSWYIIPSLMIVLIVGMYPILYPHKYPILGMGQNLLP